MGKVNKREKRTTIGVAMAIGFLAAVTAAGALYANRAYAKETLQGITKVVKNVTAKDEEGNFTNPFVILEIIPDFVEKTFTVKDMDGTTDVEVKLNVDTGSVGFYVKGQEPTTKNLKQALEKKDENNEVYLYNNSELRKNIYAEVWRRDFPGGRYWLTIDDPNAAFVDDNPRGYKELRLGEIMKYSHSFDGKDAEDFNEADPELMERLVNDGTFIALPRDYAGGNGTAYIDTAKGKMERVSATADDERGNYTLSYAPKLTAEGDLDTANDEAYKFVMGGTSTAFEKSGLPLQGEYDPYFKTIGNGEAPTHRAWFGYIENAPNGYYVKTSNQATSSVAAGTPLYRYNLDEDIYEFAGYAVTDIPLPSGGSVKSGSSEQTGQPEGSETTEPGKTVTEPENGGTTEPGSTVTEPVAEPGDSGTTEPEETTETGTGVSEETGGASESGSAQGAGQSKFGRSVLGEYRTVEEPESDPEKDKPAGEDTDAKQDTDTNKDAEDGKQDEKTEEPKQDTEDNKSDETVKDPEESTEDGKTGEEIGEQETTDGDDDGESAQYDPTVYDANLSEAYYVLHFEYLEKSGGETLYQVIGYDMDSAFNEYVVNKSAAGAIVPNVNGTGTIRLADQTGIEDQIIYDYTPKQGAYQWTSEAWLPEADRDTALYYRIRGAQIYYSTGLINRDFFKKYVFDREDDECDGLPIEVRTIPASAVTVEDVIGSSMLVLQGGEPWYGCADGLDASAYPKYSKGGHDISADVMETVKSRVKDGYPVVSDYGLFTGEGINDNESNAYNLTRTLILIDGGSPFEEGYNADNKTYNNVIKSVYNVSYGFSLNNGFCNSGFLGEKDEYGFSEVMIDIRNENVYRVASGQKKLTNSKLSQATILRYIIAYAAEPEYKQKGSLHILEIAPCASYTLRLEPSGENGKYKSLFVIKDTNDDGEILDKEFKIEFKSGDVTLTQMTTAEFIGRVEDINAYYDMIYIGSRTAAYKLGNGSVVKMNRKMNDQGEFITDYNDNDMDGLIYSNIGDTFTTKGISFYNNTNQEKTRFPGNDITEEKKKALQDFIHAGFPVVVSDELVNADGEHLRDDDRPTLSANKNTVDANSWLYSFLDEAVKHENLFRLSEVKGSLLNMYLNVGRPVITPEENSKTEKAVNATQQLFADSNGNYRAQFEFTVDTVGISTDEETYDFELYIDINADGKFSKTTERIPQISLEDENGNTIYPDDQGRYHMKPKGEDANKNYHSGKYVATYILSSSFRGVVPWKIRIIQNDDTHLRRADLIGYYEVKDDENPESISVLQICNSAWYIYKDNLLEEGADEDADFDRIDNVLLNLGGTGNTWNMEKTVKNENTQFYKLLTNQSAVPFEVTIKSIPFDWISYNHRVYLGKKLGEKNVPVDVNKNNQYDADEYLAFFRNFDMLVIGFGDGFLDPPDEMLKALLYYSEEGRSILFTHDNTSPYTYEDLHGSHFNNFLRGIFAMDRYNVMGYRTEAEGDAFKVERAYEPKAGRSGSETNNNKQAYTYPIMLRQKANGSELNNLGAMPDKYAYPSNYDGLGYWVTNKVESVNKGQITMYPYKLDDEFQVAITHSQYWQLDFTRDEDHDGESDVVVWYTLSGSGVYDQSPRDARNNYYIYNMGNITYSGVGHRDVMDQNQDGSNIESINEMKLFINTLIAAYQSGLHDPEVKIIENYNPQSRDVESIRLSYDEQLKAVTTTTNPEMDINAGVIDATEDIYFVVNSTSLVRTDTMRTHTLSADIYIEVPTEDAGELLAFKGGNAFGKKVTIQSLCRQAADGSDELVWPDAAGVYNVESGVVYKATVPVSEFSYTYEADKSTVFDEGTSEVEEGTATARNARKIFVVATESINNLRSGAKTETRSMDSLKAVRLRVFNMD